MEKKTVLNGYGIVVADRGFIYTGNINHDGDWCVVTNAQNIRRWGTSQGLGELAANGPQAETKLDAYGTVRIPASSVVSIIDSEEHLWRS